MSDTAKQEQHDSHESVIFSNKTSRSPYVLLVPLMYVIWCFSLVLKKLFPKVKSYACVNSIVNCFLPGSFLRVQNCHAIFRIQCHLFQYAHSDLLLLLPYPCLKMTLSAPTALLKTLPFLHLCTQIGELLTQ